MNTVSVPWGMWYGDRVDLSFPESWQVQVAHMRGGPDIGEDGIRAAFATPVGSPPLRELARGRRDATILFDDLSRPTPAYRIVPYLLEELAAAGLGDDQVRIVFGLGCHRALTRDDMIKKLGADLVQRLHVTNHNTHDNLEFIGVSSHGVPVWVNRDFARADCRIAAGMIAPHGPFFGGGAKLVMPGVSGYQTV
jgi:lactate racemase